MSASNALPSISGSIDASDQPAESSRALNRYRESRDPYAFPNASSVNTERRQHFSRCDQANKPPFRKGIRPKLRARPERAFTAVFSVPKNNGSRILFWYNPPSERQRVYPLLRNPKSPLSQPLPSRNERKISLEMYKSESSRRSPRPSPPPSESHS